MRHLNPTHLGSAGIGHDSDEESASSWEEASSHRHHRRGNASRGRLLLAVIFAVVASLDVALYLNMPQTWQHPATGGIVTHLIWMGALFTGIWCKQKWARFILAALSLITALVAILVGLCFVEPGANLSNGVEVVVIMISGGVYAILGWLFIVWRDFRRLTSRGQDHA